MSIARLGEWVVGYRSWRVVGTELQSQVVEHAWVPGEQVAVCKQDLVVSNKVCREGHPEPAPLHKGSCGFYARYSAPSVAPASAVDGDGEFRFGYLIGAVAARGRVFAHPRGFRAERMKIIALCPPLDERVDIEGVMDRYAVPVVQRELLETFTEEYGKPIPEYLRPEFINHEHHTPSPSWWEAIPGLLKWAIYRKGW